METDNAVNIRIDPYYVKGFEPAFVNHSPGVRPEAYRDGDSIKSDIDPVNDQSWILKARCRGLEPILLYPEPGDAAGEAAAKAICESCVVRKVCLESALKLKEKEGVRGGLTEDERRRLLRRRRRAEKNSLK